MPGRMSGLDLAEQVHQDWPDFELIVTSGGLTLEDSDLPDNGTFLSKPYPVSRLVEIVDQKVEDRSGESGPLPADRDRGAPPSPGTFTKGRDFAAWVGLTPRQHSTGGEPGQGPGRANGLDGWSDRSASAPSRRRQRGARSTARGTSNYKQATKGLHALVHYQV